MGTVIGILGCSSLLENLDRTQMGMHRLAAQELLSGGLTMQRILVDWHGFRVVGYLIRNSL